MSVGSFCGCLNFKLAFRSSFAHMGKSSSFHQNLPQKKWSAKLKSKKTAEKVWHVSLKAIMSTHLRVLLFAGCASGPCQRLAKGSSWKKRGGACQKQRRARVASERSRCGPRWKKGDGKKPEAMKVEDLRDVKIQCYDIWTLWRYSKLNSMGLSSDLFFNGPSWKSQQWPYRVRGLHLD